MRLTPTGLQSRFLQAALPRPEGDRRNSLGSTVVKPLVVIGNT